MIQILEGTSPNVISTKAVGKLNKEDQDRLLSLLNQKLDDREKFSWYFEMEKFVGWEPGADWNELKNGLPEAGHVNKIAVVGARDWLDLLKKMMQPVSSELRFFEAHQKQEALEWVEN